MKTNKSLRRLAIGLSFLMAFLNVPVSFAVGPALTGKGGYKGELTPVKSAIKSGAPEPKGSAKSSVTLAKGDPKATAASSKGGKK